MAERGYITLPPDAEAARQAREGQVGRGREFEKLREYIPGDSFDEIHWKATARRARPITKVFQVERTREVYVAVDLSRLSARTHAVATESAFWSSGSPWTLRIPDRMARTRRLAG